MPQHIGIVGCSAEGAALCYRTVCLEGESRLGPYDHPEVTLHTFPLARYLESIERDDWAGVGRLMLASAHKLHAAGADFLICPDNTIHQGLPFIRSRSPLPWLHIAAVVAGEARRRGWHRLGITGTRFLVESDVYPHELAAQGLECVRPGPEDRAGINRIIFEELVRGVQSAAAVEYFRAAFGRLKEAGCDAVVLGCTEIPLIMNDANSPLPTLDSTRLLARAALERATA
ncbi:MAG: amino acid racemase [Proteobacteria bacterium]|nr:amino acid racemase [Pseudomonadota bacterium]